jgi:hypothetical protein
MTVLVVGGLVLPSTIIVVVTWQSLSLEHNLFKIVYGWHVPASAPPSSQ